MQCSSLTPPPDTGTPTGNLGRLLIIDDEAPNRMVLRDPLEASGYEILEAGSGPEALRAISEGAPDAILLDVMMPGMDGFQLCRRLKSNQATAAVPVLLVTALAERKERLLGIQAGASDFLNKPVDFQDLLLRVGNAVRTKRLHDQLQVERDKSEKIMQRLLPASVAERMKQGAADIADHFPDASVLWGDLTGIGSPGPHPPEETIWLVNEIVSAFDQLVEEHELEKIKTAGLAYVAAGGLTFPRPDHAEAMVELALDLQRAIRNFNEQYDLSLGLHIGIHCGPVMAGVIGRKQFTYDLWGDTVEVAARLRFIGQPGEITASEAVYERLKDAYTFTARRNLDLNSHGQICGYTLSAPAPPK